MPADAVERDETGLRPSLEWIGQDIDRLFDALLAVPDDGRRRLYEAMRHAAIGGGKRMRPLLVSATCALFAVDRDRALRVGLAVECIHVYSLIHDDLPAMDDDDLRRGRPTVHVAYDEATAVLAGDCLNALAFEILADPATHERIRASVVASTLAVASSRIRMRGSRISARAIAIRCR